MNEYVCDDRIDINKLAKKIEKMSDEEFAEYLRELKGKENGAVALSMICSLLGRQVK